MILPLKLIASELNNQGRIIEKIFHLILSDFIKVLSLSY
ncbi:hypothetical protein J2Y60_002709 [Arcicella sp. BE140]|nr:hypothetical protein [Arcicella sp. BE51]MDR6812510.1 hypothetical protein [Arcicella sp. BE140]MDR6823718.1 hypothetical protein [Arcicella sp. BE139]